MSPPYSMICNSVPGPMRYFFRSLAWMTICPFDNVLTIPMSSNLLAFLYYVFYNRTTSLPTRQSFPSWLSVLSNVETGRRRRQDPESRGPDEEGSPGGGRVAQGVRAPRGEKSAGRRRRTVRLRLPVEAIGAGKRRIRKTAIRRSRTQVTTPSD